MKNWVLFLAMLLSPAAASAQIVPLPMQGSSSAEASHLFTGTVMPSITINWQSASTARYLFIFDSTSTATHNTTPCAASNASQVNGCLLYCAYLPNSTSAPNIQTFDWSMHPFFARTGGIVAALSTGAGCGTFTADGANNFFYSQTKP